MTRTSDFSIRGGKEISEVLAALPKEYRRRALVHSFRAGAKVIEREAKLIAARDISVNFADAITVARPNNRQRISRGQRDTIVVLGFKVGKYSKLAHIFEFGTVERFKKTGSFTGAINATPFFRPALDSKGGAAIQVISKITEENLKIIIRQLARGKKVSLAKKNRSV